jgi:NAD+ kinase
MGINLGGLGFLTATPLEGMDAALAQVWAGAYSEEPRSMLEASISTGPAINRQIALNEFVIGRGPVPRLIELEIRVDDSVLTRYRSDGVIVSSPTGSTAYSLAAGGAIVCPNAEVFTITPICPHTLSNRSVIVNLDAEIQVRVLSPRIEIFLSADGQVQIPLAPGDAVRFRRSPLGIRLLRLAGSSFFETLRQKLNWSGSPV